MKNLKKKLKKISIILLSIITGFWFVFALLSGAEEYGGGLRGIIMNSPNSLPWLILFLFILLANKKPLIGGITISLLAIISLFMFDYPLMIFLIPLPLLILGGMLIVSNYIKE